MKLFAIVNRIEPMRKAASIAASDIQIENTRYIVILSCQDAHMKRASSSSYQQKWIVESVLRDFNNICRTDFNAIVANDTIQPTILCVE